MRIHMAGGWGTSDVTASSQDIPPADWPMSKGVPGAISTGLEECPSIRVRRVNNKKSSPNSQDIWGLPPRVSIIYLQVDRGHNDVSSHIISYTVVTPEDRKVLLLY
ncbi:hypothetical protein H112_08799 [Trichophyton rubrum D6]|uniref:Uncharacterized protein n=2 Tax=Trichophyton TaxID=5550 RepID=A0A022VNP0_TRIRU|nr:hypothetical protein H100_08820 [Trichophyton rubrum MR850]EZF36782.1 hypothetical protein H102_08780 [Trichophyton rubrum CBS 100081]EZF47383.1 hypothetical protein H103_08802 [Trichophyton rubrum CBS 288.86]EZF57950.1 hypothetical protein H104_08751 [Trichophyton rubrum CBS 289.86]EZF68598.1 hypothetical protein H105_08805 [Trichophyton soudanense CBS 452.61]EZF79352.1 hypothetical protein H110_08804 [Trichophyton rubrum MR1448]EZF90245.1 hypothetical protein H113_08872 [Trichophyton rub